MSRLSVSTSAVIVVVLGGASSPYRGTDPSRGFSLVSISVTVALKSAKEKTGRGEDGEGVDIGIGCEGEMESCGRSLEGEMSARASRRDCSWN